MIERPKVLVVDDDPMLLSLLTDTLDSIGYNSISVGDAESALESFENNYVDIVIADINLPGIDGLELLRRIKTNAPSLPVVLITGVSMADVRSRAFEAGADGFLDKPFRIAVIEKMLQQLLNPNTTRNSAIIVVDDNDEYRDMLGDNLIDRGFRVVTARNGTEALGKLKNGNVNVVLTDLIMPGMNGIEVARTVKAISPSTHVVIYTGHVPNDREESDIRATADEFLSKPISLDQIADILSRIEFSIESGSVATPAKS